MDQNVEKRVASIESKYRSMADKFIDAIWVVDAETLKYLYISQDIYKLRGYTQEEVLGKKVDESMTPESHQKIQKLFKKGNDDYNAGIHKSYNADIEVYHKNGSTIWIEISAKFFKENNESLKIVGITRNIDKRKKAEQKQEEITKKLKKALKEKKELLQKVKQLESLLPICSGCRRIRDEKNKWWPLEKYVESKSDSKFSHTICPDCKAIYYPEE